MFSSARHCLMPCTRLVLRQKGPSHWRVNVWRENMPPFPPCASLPPHRPLLCSQQLQPQPAAFRGPEAMRENGWCKWWQGGWELRASSPCSNLPRQAPRHDTSADASHQLRMGFSPPSAGHEAERPPRRSRLGILLHFRGVPTFRRCLHVLVARLNCSLFELTRKPATAGPRSDPDSAQ